MVFWFSKEVSAVCGMRRQKPGLRTAKPNLSPYVQNIYRIEVKDIILEIVHQGLSWEIYSDFSFFSLWNGPVENYWHWLLKVSIDTLHCLKVTVWHMFLGKVIKKKKLCSWSNTYLVVKGLYCCSVAHSNWYHERSLWTRTFFPLSSRSH